MSQVNVDQLSQESLKNLVVAQSKTLRLQQMQIEHLKGKLKKSDEDYEILGDKLMQARAILNS